uniref:3-carboxymuconate cyclase n=1 Tax=Solibacter usitatus (strain Ellin6076) TaxID=234267 RepID=Q025Y5_SOLUE
MFLKSMLLCAAAFSAAFAGDESITQAKPGRGQDPLFLTITNGANNFLAVINTRTKETDYVPTGGFGGASGNAGGVAVSGNLAAAVNFGSTNVTIFVRHGNAMEPAQLIKTSSQPVSVAFGHNHLVVLGQTTAESFAVFGNTVSKDNDGVVQLAKGDKSAAQILTFDGGVVYSEKSGSVAELNLSTNGMAGISGPNRPIQLPNAPNNDTPYGMAARGGNVYVTIAHSNLEALVVNGQIMSLGAGPTPFKDGSGNIMHAPCWNALAGQFLFSSDSPGKQLYRYLVSDSNVFFDKAAAARLNGSPTDLAATDNLLGVIDGGDGTTSNVSLFDIDSEGELTLRFAVKIAGPINGSAIIG